MFQLEDTTAADPCQSVLVLPPCGCAVNGRYLSLEQKIKLQEESNSNPQDYEDKSKEGRKTQNLTDKSK